MKTERGFSLVELMVSLVIGMLAVAFVMRSMVNFEANRREGVGGTDAMQNGVAALLAMEAELSQAGWGINHPQLSGCAATFFDNNGFQLTNVGGGNPTPLAPVVIGANANLGAPDTISIYSTGSVTGTNALDSFNDPTVGTNTIDINDGVAFGFNNRDVLALAQTNGVCSLVEAGAAPVQVAAATGTLTRVNISGARFSPAGGLPAAYISTNTKVFNLGNEAELAFHTWSVLNGRLMLRATDLAGSEAAPSPVASNIVSIKALYGFDTRPPVGGAWAADGGTNVNQWSRFVIDADGNGVVGNRDDYQRIVAIRLAIVARNREPQKIPASGVCDMTANAPVVFSRQEPNGVASIPITVNVDVAGAPADFWKCYQYRVFETIVPLRNASWRPGL